MIRITGTKGALVATHRSVDVLTLDRDGNQTKTSVKMEERSNTDYYKNLHAHLLHGEKLIITPEWARRVIQVLDYAGRSARKGAALKVKYK